MKINLSWFRKGFFQRKTTGPEFYLTCTNFGEFVLPKVLAQWYTRRKNVTVGKAPSADAAIYCRQETVDGTVDCCNPNCPILHFHLSWYYPQNLSKEALSNNQLALQVKL